MFTLKECIQVINLSKTFHKKDVVKSLTFSVEYGEIFALLGPNGAGKSTTMKMLSTLLQKNAGHIIIDGMDIDLYHHEIKKKIGIVFQEDILDKELTVYENLYYRGGLYTKSNHELNRKIQQVVQLLSIDSIREQNYGTCSGGQKRLVQIGRALLAEPKVLILDEPTVGLDPKARKYIWNAIMGLKEKLNMTVVFTTHYMEETFYADHICIMQQGDILLCDTLENIYGSKIHKNQLASLDELYIKLLEKKSINL